MVTNNKAIYVGDNKVLAEAAGLSTDAKPTTGIANGSTFIEMDTSKLYFFDEASGTWKEWS